jgi:CcmD family protein
VSTGEKYVAAAYLVLFAALLLYVALIAMKLTRIQRELDELARLARERAGG